MTVSNTQSILPVGVLAGRNTYPEMETLQKAIENLSSRAWFVPATDIAVELNTPIVTNIVLLGAMLGAGLLPIEVADVKKDMGKYFCAGIN